MKSTVLFKQTITILIVVTMLFLCAEIASAKETLPDFHRKGSVTVTMKSGGDIVHGGEMALYKVADIFEDDGKVGFVLTENFKECKASLEDIYHAELPLKLSTYVEKHNLEGRVKSVDANGEAVFGDLSAGLYLICQIEEGSGNYVSQPFLAELPYYDAETDKWEYDIKASPKVSPDEPTTWTDNPNSNVPTTPDEHKLPHTGQHNLPVPILVVTGVLLIIIGLVLYHEKGKKK